MKEVGTAAASDELRREEERVEGRSAVFRPEEVDLSGPIAQVLTRGFGILGAFAAGAVSLVIMAVVGRQVALMSIYLTANARLPMVAGWDVVSPYAFAARLVAVTLAFNLAGAALYRAERRRRRGVAPEGA